MAVTLGAWLSSLQALLPPGRALTVEPDAVLTRVLEAVAARMLAAETAMQDLLRQMDPRAATDLLPDWERLLGLPDDCAPAGQEVSDRQRAAFGRLTELGGQSPSYFIDLADRNGEPGVSITEFRPMDCTTDCDGPLLSESDAHTWRVDIPRPAQSVRIMTCNSAANSALQMYTPSAIECFFNERKPAQSKVIFAYAA